eukprot:438365-Pleurochrysis_carterae.AAC.1
MAALPLLVLFRQDGHCGSRWIGEMLASQNVSVLFEFGGVCPERFAQKKIVSNDASKDVESIDNLVEGACSCAAADAQVMFHQHKHAYICVLIISTDMHTYACMRQCQN